MAIKPSPTIAGKLRKLFSNNKQTIEPAIGDSIPGGSGGAFIISYDHSEQVVTPNNPEITVYVYDKTFAEANEAIRAHIPVYVYTASDDFAVLEYVEGAKIQEPTGKLFQVGGKMLMQSIPGVVDGKLFRYDLPFS